MNKQAIAFLTMFSLILMLSVYYITMPTNSSKIVKESGAITDLTDIGVMKEALAEKRNVLETKYNDILSSSNSKEEAKKDALSSLNSLKSNQTIEQNLVNTLKEHEYEGCLVEIDDEVMNVICPKQYKGDAAAIDILKIVTELTNNKFVCQVSFK